MKSHFSGSHIINICTMNISDTFPDWLDSGNVDYSVANFCVKYAMK
jgi:hypothetical protein